MRPLNRVLRLVLWFTAISLIAATCGVSAEQTVRPIDDEQLPERLRPSEPAPTTTSEPQRGFPVTIFLFSQEGDDPAQLVPRTRTVPQPNAESALRALLAADPTEEEEALGLRTFFGPAALAEEPIELLSAQIRQDLLRIDLSGPPVIEGVLGPLPWAQLVFTATQQFREGQALRRVRFLSDGTPVSLQVQDGDSRAGVPVTRDEYSRYDPEAPDEPSTTTSETPRPPGDLPETFDGTQPPTTGPN